MYKWIVDICEKKKNAYSIHLRNVYKNCIHFVNTCKYIHKRISCIHVHECMDKFQSIHVNTFMKESWLHRYQVIVNEYLLYSFTNVFTCIHWNSFTNVFTCIHWNSWSLGSDDEAKCTTPQNFSRSVEVEIFYLNLPDGICHFGGNFDIKKPK